MAEEPQNPLGMHLDFLFGRGYLWAKDERLNDWMSLDHLKMEIPDLSFPFDVRGGLQRFRHTRCHIHEIGMSVSEVGLGDMLRQGAREIDGFDDLQVNFVDGAAHVTTRVRALGANTFLSFRVGLIPPEPSRADEVHLSLYDYRAYGPLPYPARILGFEFLSRLLQTSKLRPPGRGSAYKVGIAGDLLSLRPLKLILLSVFASVGWKMPDLSLISLEDCRIRPGHLTIRARVPSRSESMAKPGKFDASVEGARSLAAYEAKDLFVQADAALFESDVELAYERYSELRQTYGNHPQLVDRLLDCLLATPTVANLAEAETLCRELESDDGENVRVLLARATISALRNDQDTPEAFEKLSHALRERGEIYDYVLSELTRAEYVGRGEPEAAAEILSGLLAVAPRHRGVLESLRTLYDQLGDTAQLEGILKRLTGVYSDRESLSQTYLELSKHLMDRRGEVTEARVFLERVLRLDPTHVEALNILGESYIISGEPLRALKAFSSAARTAEDAGDLHSAAGYLFRVAQLWSDEVRDFDQALLASRRALQLSKGLASFRDARLDHLMFAGHLCLSRERFDEAIGYFHDAAIGFEALAEEKGGIAISQAADAHMELGKIYWDRARFDVAANHFERSFHLRPSDIEVLDKVADAYGRLGMPDKLLSLYRDALAKTGSSPENAQVNLRMARLLSQMGIDDHAERALNEALRRQPDLEEARVELFGILARAGRFRDLLELAERMTTQQRHHESRANILSDYADALDATNVGAGDAARARVRAFDAAPESRRAIEGILTLSERGVEAEGLSQAVSQIMGGPRLRSDAEGVDDRIEEILDSRERPRETGFDEPTSTELEQTEVGSDEEIEVFRSRLEEVARTDSPMPSTGSVSPDSAMARVLRRTPEAAPQENRPQFPESDTLAPTEDADANLAALRNADDPLALADGIRLAIARTKDKSKRLALEKEVGELLYYELEDSQKSRPYLERVRDEDPEGLGSDPNLLGALEAIYEEAGDLEARVKILEERFDRAESDEMRTVYRLLIAQTSWEASGDRARAEKWLAPILERDEKHEASNRLLAEIAMEAEDYAAAVVYFGIVVEVSPDGLDSVEVERKLAETLLLKLDEPKRAMDHFASVLRAAPGDSRALDGIKQCQATLGDWDGFNESLRKELGLLMGKVQGMSEANVFAIDVGDVSTAIRVPASQIVMDLARIAELQKEDIDSAFRLYRLAQALWPEQVEAVERQVAIARTLNDSSKLALSLETYADLLLNPNERFETLAESARHFAMLGEAQKATELYASAIAIAESEATPPPGVDQVRRAFDALKKEDG